MDVITEALPDDAKHIGLDADAINVEVEKQLADAGVRVLTRDERLSDFRHPYLYINCNILFLEGPKAAVFSIDVESHQRTLLQNGEEAQVLTWAKSYLGVRGKDEAAAAIQQAVARLVKQFVRDFRIANPAKKIEGREI